MPPPPSRSVDTGWMRRSDWRGPAGPADTRGTRAGGPGPVEWEDGWISRQVEAMASAWSRGEPVPAEAILAQYPELGDEAAIRLIYEETCIRRESGEEVATTEVVRRFPRWDQELRILLGCDRLLGPLSRVAVLPEAGEDLGPFRLVAELGRGASGKTYLAAEPALADRLVVLKVLSDDQEEHLSLARLPHTHIIPLFSEHAFPDRGLRALCMPYLGGTSLARILEAMAGVPLGARRGRLVLEVLDRIQAGRPVPPRLDGPYRRYLEQASYVQAICWIGACLADALHYAHAHGLVHMDVKPSNVLIATDGLPILLDFHLARRPIAEGERIPDRIGGTPGWMAPEHRAALEAAGAGDAVPGAVDHRADLYALGLLLAESLGGPAPSSATGRPGWDATTLRRRNPEVSVGLAAIIAHCLAASPSARYGDAALLADDLRRHLNDLPLRGVPNRSVRERWRKWRRRRPAGLVRTAAWLTFLGFLAGMAVLTLGFYRQGVAEIQSALEDGRRLCTHDRYTEAVEALRRGLDRTVAFPFRFRDDLTRSLRASLRVAQRGKESVALHELAERVRFHYGIEPPGPAEAVALLPKIRAIWDQRHRLLPAGDGSLEPPLAGHVQRLRQQARSDLLELVGVWADWSLRRVSTAETPKARDEAWRVVEEARVLCGPSFAVDRLRQALASARGQAELVVGPDTGLRNAPDHYDLGRSHLGSGQLREAAAEFRQALEQRPLDFWPNFYLGLCSYRLRRFHDADAAFGICIALAPSSAPCYFNRAKAAEALGRIDQAFGDYTRAWKFDPHLAAALLNRGILSYQRRQYSEAIEDFRRALRDSPHPQSQGQIHYNLALAYLGQGDRSAALASAEDAVARGYAEALGLRDRLRNGF